MGAAITNCAILILAAGQSSRLGHPKQLLSFDGSSLVRRVAKTALDAHLGKVFVVVGANANLINDELNMPGLCLIENDAWEEGMASSIRKGILQISDIEPSVDGVMILVCDQPYLEADLLQKILQKQNETELPMVASVYGGKPGTPAVFHRSKFPLLLELKGDTGARKIFADHAGELGLMPFDKGIIDIDTKEDYEKLVHNQ